ncbi:MAG: PocR ligand-binding domain-containing protein [Mariniphaga sp.]|nr:PocR ligand-binding domain-containing protein [Mariniphaga sp.]
MKLYCNSCSTNFEIGHIGNSISQCPNPKCHAPYYYKIFKSRNNALTFYRTVDSWKPKYFFKKDDDYWIVSYFNDLIKPINLDSIMSLVEKEEFYGILFEYFKVHKESIQFISVQKSENNGFEFYISVEYNQGNDNSYYMGNPSKFCEFICKKNLGVKKCKNYLIEIIRQYLENPPYKSKWKFCWCHLVYYIVPIIFHREIVGILLSGGKRFDDFQSNIDLSKNIRNASEDLNLNYEYLNDLINKGEEIRKINIGEINRNLKKLNQKAGELINIAEKKYSDMSNLRSHIFFEEISAKIKNISNAKIENETILWENIEKILSRILNYLECFDSIAILNETLPKSEMYKFIAGQGEVDRNITTKITDEEFNKITPKQVGPILIRMINKSQLYKAFSNKIIFYEISLGYVIRMLTKANRYLILVLAAREHKCKYNSNNNFCLQCSAIGRNFMELLSDNFVKDIDLLMYIYNLGKEEKRKVAFLTSTAHSLSLPVNSLLIDAANLRDEVVSNQRAHDEALHFFYEVQTLHLVTQSILHGAEKITDQPNPRLIKCSLLIPLRESCEMFLGEASEKGCDIRIYIEANENKISIIPAELNDSKFYKRNLYIPKVNMVQNELSLAFKNILNNAIKYSYRTEKYGNKRYVEVICRLASNQKYEIEISNYGIGIEESEIEKGLIWKPRWRGKLARDRNRMGSGFGLPFAKRVIEDIHKGNIKVESKLLYDSVYLTIFTIILPVLLPNENN